MADDYDITLANPARDPFVGADDYNIIPSNLAGPHHGGGHHRGFRRDVRPDLFIPIVPETVDIVYNIDDDLVKSPEDALSYLAVGESWTAEGEPQSVRGWEAVGGAPGGSLAWLINVNDRFLAWPKDGKDVPRIGKYYTLSNPGLRKKRNNGDEFYMLAELINQRFGTKYPLIAEDPQWKANVNWRKALAKMSKIAGARTYATAHPYHKHCGFFCSIGHDVTSVGKDIVHVYNKVGSLAGKIPGIGGALHAVLGLDPAKMIGNLGASVVKGERLDHALLDAGKGQIKAIKEVAPYAKMVASLVPGVGTGISAAIATGEALASGRSITDAVLDGVKGAIPGGAASAAVFDATRAVMRGERLDHAAIDAAIKQLPSAVQSSVTAVLHGQNPTKGLVLQALRAALPTAIQQKAADIATAVSHAANIQAASVGALMTPQGIAKVAQVGAQALKMVPELATPAKALSGTALDGYRTAIGTLAHSGATPMALAAIRSKLPEAGKQGFDHGVNTYLNHLTPGWTTLISHGVLKRGNWKAVAKNVAGATRGRLVANGKVTHGYFVTV